MNFKKLYLYSNNYAKNLLRSTKRAILERKNLVSVISR